MFDYYKLYDVGPILLSLGMIDEHYLWAMIDIIICHCNLYSFVHVIEVHVRLINDLWQKY